MGFELLFLFFMIVNYNLRDGKLPKRKITFERTRQRHPNAVERLADVIMPRRCATTTAAKDSVVRGDFRFAFE